ncbi:50S ribosomal protein L20 [Patescibacteria group bacterium]
MSRVKRGVLAKKKHKKLKKQASGMIHTRRASVKRAREALLKAGTNAYIGRKQKKRTIRRVWITRINAALRKQDLTYSKFIKILKDKKIELDRKVLAHLASEEPEVFKKIIEEVKK